MAIMLFIISVLAVFSVSDTKKTLTNIILAFVFAFGTLVPLYILHKEGQTALIVIDFGKTEKSHE